MMRARVSAAARGGLLLAGVGLVAAACGSSGGGAGSGAGTTAATVASAGGSAGTHLTDSSGRALYLWMGDSGGTSKCSGACASAWPPLLSSGRPTAIDGARTADLGTITRSDGSHQVTYAGHPLYYFAGDTGAGDTSGEGSNGFGAKWWLVAPSGTAITGTGSPGTAPTSSAPGGYTY